MRADSLWYVVLTMKLSDSKVVLFKVTHSEQDNGKSQFESSAIFSIRMSVKI